ncbi:sensor histidine kinase [Flaviaesturariibacter amylovorans]|uniref:histidine kinase n=1 Tax=Flaviaesturariibacter amylovorans TaxID=1084520 RepID=A0ABP8HVS7_9BACT
MLHDQLTATSELALLLADAMPQLVWIADKAGAVTYFNKRVEEFAGARRGPGGYWEWQDMIHPHDLPATAAAWSSAMSTGTCFEVEHRMRRADGCYEWHLTRALPQTNAEGIVQHWFGTATNIHQQKLAQQVLCESEERFRLLTNSIPQIVWTTGPEGKTEFINDRWLTYTGQQAADTDGRMVMMHPDDLPFIMESWQEAQRAGASAEWEYRLLNQDTGRYRWFAARILPLKDETGTVLKWIGAATDIQNLKDTAGELERQVAERTRELHRLNAALEAQAEELRRSNEDLEQFAHVASHDLKEPLRKLRTFGNRIVTDYGHLLPEKGVSFLGKMEASAARMGQMIDGVLHYSLLGSMEQRLVRVDLNEVLTHIEADLEVLVQQKSALLVRTPLPAVAGVPVLLHQLFYNLIQNALKFSRAGVVPEIEVSVTDVHPWERQEPGYVAIRVCDNGIGFDPQFARSIFKTFTRLHSQDHYEGTGLGLALCQKIVQRHRGRIRAEGTPGAGATFTVLLPTEGE